MVEERVPDQIDIVPSNEVADSLNLRGQNESDRIVFVCAFFNSFVKTKDSSVKFSYKRITRSVPAAAKTFPLLDQAQDQRVSFVSFYTNSNSNIKYKYIIRVSNKNKNLI